MEIQLVASTDSMKYLDTMIRFSQDPARVCYSEKNFKELEVEPFNKNLINTMFKGGHHSVFEHVNLTFYMQDIPKILAMIFNNEKQYATSEKSARYTQMLHIDSKPRELYDKWMNLLIPEINKVYPQMSNSQKRDISIKKLAQENARYMTSIFVPTKMVYTINLRQFNFLIHEFEKFYQEHKKGNNLKARLAKSMQEFLEQTSRLKIKGLQNKTDRHLSLFSDREVEEHFDDDYSTSYLTSFAGLAQAHRHRTINYHISKGTELGAPLGFFIPKIISGDRKLTEKWLDDLTDMALFDFPQAQLIKINERGIIEDFRSKALLRMCGHAQHEIMKKTLETAEKYKQYQKEYSNALKPKCLQGITCPGPCVWGGKSALERIV